MHDVEAIASLPGKSSGKDREKQGESDKEGTDSEGSDKKDDNKNDVMVDEACWVYEQLRRAFPQVSLKGLCTELWIIDDLHRTLRTH